MKTPECPDQIKPVDCMKRLLDAIKEYDRIEQEEEGES